MSETRWWTYVQRLLDVAGWTPADLSRASGIDQSLIGRWRNKGSTPEPASVQAVATAFGRPVIEAIIASGHYTPEQLQVDQGSGVDPETVDLSPISDDRMIDELRERLRSRHQRPSREPRRRGTRTTTTTVAARNGGPSTTTTQPAGHDQDHDHPTPA